MGKFGSATQKALLPYRERAVLSHIFERFGPERKYVIAVGQFADDLRDYCSLLHPEYQIQWVSVEKTSGAGAGPGLSILSCKQWLNGNSFYVVCSDTYWDERVDDQETSNWIGVGEISPVESKDYCNVVVEGDRIVGLLDKVGVSADIVECFIGLAHIADSADFFDGLERDLETIQAKSESRELSLAAGFNSLIRKSAMRRKMVSGWKDLGTLERYVQAHDQAGIGNYKSDEFYYHVGSKVAKFSTDLSSLQNRLERGEILSHLLPAGVRLQGRFLSYQYSAGKAFYGEITPKRFEKFLNWMDVELWSRTPDISAKGFAETCDRFYRTKTEQRISRFEGKYSGALSWSGKVNGTNVPSVKSLLENIPWVKLMHGNPVPFHGDLHFDNIIYNSSRDAFVLVDWRPDFAGEIQLGDFYYEMAKLKLGMEIHLGKVRNGDFSFKELPAGDVSYELPELKNKAVYSEILETFARAHDLETKRIDLIVALACLNMAALHQAPFDQLIFHEGRRRLFSWMEAFRETTSEQVLLGIG